jgi:transposase
MDPFHVVRLAGDALEAHPPPGAALLTEKQHARLEALFAVSEHVEVEATWGIYQRMIAPTANPTRSMARP